MFVRSIAMEGAIGPVAGSSHHSLYYRMPGVRIKSPMTPKEYRRVYDEFMSEDEVYYVSEHRGAYANSYELSNIYYDKPDLALFCISITRFAGIEVAKHFLSQGIKISLHHIVDIKPLGLDKSDYRCAKTAKKALVIDDDYEDGIAKNIAFEIHSQTNCQMFSMGLKDKTAGFHPKVDNLPPSKEEIIIKINNILCLS
jgi:pyruvate/2-oxoglutarate/acetoin dehydrogenase E1 component